jgi:hypothetical protein
MTEDTKQPFALPPGISLDELTQAYIHATLIGAPMHNPIYESVAHIDGRWLRISHNITHQWLDELPPEVAAILPTAGNA